MLHPYFFLYAGRISETNISTSFYIMSTFEVTAPEQWTQTCSNIRFRFIQPEHRGGFCNCWEVGDLTVMLTNGETRELR